MAYADWFGRDTFEMGKNMVKYMDVIFEDGVFKSEGYLARHEFQENKDVYTLENDKLKIFIRIGTCSSIRISYNDAKPELKKLADDTTLQIQVNHLEPPYKFHILTSMCLVYPLGMEAIIKMVQEKIERLDVSEMDVVE
ncbi:hypothetical protein JD501_01845 [Aeromonas hydrophila]|uniref:hypothetical protein n=1 Tax=Aeromonas hydrophila TaxID=644 RepID=UPI00191D4A1F|nr:hypothetical protein [Aeromonas hydrophila]MBL0431975.1 hypothetical protein [Aeromonas hydrophila]MBL0467946.1 hypothetical protein [Aeromonas hydrophila]